MFSGEYIWQSPDWPQWRFDMQALAPALERVSHAQGMLLGRLADVGMALRDRVRPHLEAICEDASAAG